MNRIWAVFDRAEVETGGAFKELIQAVKPGLETTFQRLREARNTSLSKTSFALAWRKLTDATCTTSSTPCIAGFWSGTGTFTGESCDDSAECDEGYDCDFLAWGCDRDESCEADDGCDLCSEERCTACAEGTFAASSGTTSCADCPVGTFASNEASTSCTTCWPGATTTCPWESERARRRRGSTRR